MEGVDPDTLLEWLQTGVGDERDIQLMALEQLCMLLLMSDNIDQCFESCPPRTFLPALCKIFLDESATENVLEVTARAITYYLDVSNECTRRITQVDGAVKAICNRLAVAEMSDRTSKDLAEQCVKLLEHVCQRETAAVYDAGGLQCMLTMVRQHGQYVHKDTVHSAMTVITRLCSKMEPNDSAMPECCASLGALLEHDDPKVYECALRCFAALTDRFIRKNMDPVEMVQHGNLVEHLLNSLVPTHLVNSGSNVSGGFSRNASGTSALTADLVTSSPATASIQPTSFTSVIISLLINLCRGSSSATEQVVSSPLLVVALKTVLTSKDERCVMDALRLGDLLVVLLCEGRRALPKTIGATVTSSEIGPLFTVTSGSDRSNRHLIDAIRQRDTDAVIDAIESGQVDANFADDVGQTLLNWSSAFGTTEMVTYLCEKGADVNRGQRSTSLHYAACFGRPDIVKILLKHGADPDLRDEEGKTALDKAREKAEEGHQQVASILENPSTYMEEVDEEKVAKIKVESVKETNNEKIDPTVICQLLNQLLRILCDVYQRSLGMGVHKASLSLLRKTICHISPDSLELLITNDDNEIDATADNSVSKGQHIVENLVNVLVTGLEHDDDVEAHENVLQIIKSLFLKNKNFWLDQLVRVGIFEKVEAIANQPTAQLKGGIVTTMVVDETGRISSSSSVTVMDNILLKASEVLEGENSGSSSRQDNASNLSAGRGFECSTPLTVTYPARTLDENVMFSVPVYTGGELDPADATPPTEPGTTTPPPTLEMSSSGNVTPERRKYSISMDLPSAIDDQWEITEGRNYQWKDWRLIKSQDSFFIWCDAVAVEFSDGSNGWFRFLLDGQLSTMYSSGSPEGGSDSAETRGEFLDKLTRARNAVPVRSIMHSIFTVPGTNRTIEVGKWILASPKANELTVTNRDGNQQRLIIVEDLPGFVFESNRQTKHCFQAEKTLGLDFVTGWAARGGGRRLRFRAETQKAKVQEMAKEIWESYSKEAQSKPRDALVELQQASSTVKEICRNKTGLLPEDALSELEVALKCIHSSVVNDRLLSTFELSISGIVNALLIYLELVQNSEDREMSLIFKKVFVDQRSLVALVRKMVAVLDATEKLPQYLYDTPGGSSFGLQLLGRRIKIRLEHLNRNGGGSPHLLDRTGRTMKIEPLATVRQLKSYISRMVAKQWYDRTRDTFHFVKEIKEIAKRGAKLPFTYTSDFDDKGVIYWLGTNGGTVADWTNPASVNVVYVTSSEGERLPYGRHEYILSRDAGAHNCHTSDDINAYFTVDLGVYLFPNTYTLRHARGYGRSALRNWILQGSHNGRLWDSLVIHQNDTSLNYPGSTASWPVNCQDGKGPYRYFRISQNGVNASNQNHYLSLSGFEIYGDIVDVVVDDFKVLDEKPLVGFKPLKKCAFGSKDRMSTKACNVDELPSSSNRDVRVMNPLNDAVVANLPGGWSNNKVVSGTYVSDVVTSMSSSSMRNRIFRYRRGSRFLAGNLGRGRLVNLSDTTELCPIGTRVVRGPDWKWGNQGNNTEGTVVSIIDNGWVDVHWDDQTSNSYRFGAEGKYDIEVKAYQRGSHGTSARHHMTTFSSMNCSYAPPPGFYPRQLPPVPPTFRENSPPRSARKVKSSSGRFPHSQNLSSYNRVEMSETVPNESCFACGSWDHTTENCTSSFANTGISRRPEISEEDRSESILEARVNANASQQSSTIAQKSMSTTNLPDGFDIDKRASVASTNQAASAESLQHQTPSLENLLARSRVFNDRIPEVVSDEMPLQLDEHHLLDSSVLTVDTDQESISANNNVVLDASFESFDGGVTVDGNPVNTNVSVAASSYGGGSQPVLHKQNRGTFGESQPLVEQRDTCSSPRDSVHICAQNEPVLSGSRNIMSLEETNARNLASLSISVPNLPVFRQRQQLGTTSNTEQEPLPEDVVYAEELMDDEEMVLGSEKDNTVADVVYAEELMDGEEMVLCNEIPANEINDNAVAGVVYAELLNETQLVSHDRTTTNEMIDNTDAEGLVYARELMDVEIMQIASDRAIPTNENKDNTARVDVVVDINAEESGKQEYSSDARQNDYYNCTEASAEPSQAENIGSRSTAMNGFSELAEAAARTAHSNATASASGTSVKKAFRPASVTQHLGGSQRDRNESTSRSRIGNYADVLRNVVMQQFIDSGGPLTSMELEEIEDDLYDDEMQDEGNEDDGDEEYATGLSVDALAQAAVAMHSQSGTLNDLKLNWKQVMMSEAERMLAERNTRTSSSNNKRGVNRNWDDDFVLKHQLPALIPAFDPRPGRNNINQTQDVELPQNISRSQSEASAVGVAVELEKEPDLRLYIRGPNLVNVENVMVELDDDDRSLFYYLQQIVQSVEWGQKTERTKRVWEPTYTVVYGDNSPGNESVQTANRKVDQMNRIPESIAHTLSVISRLQQIGSGTAEYELTADIFVSEKLTQKLMQELADPLIVSARALPSWCNEIIFNYPCLFSAETRISYFQATAFGTSRSIVWLQARRDQILEQSRGAASSATVSNLAGARRDDHYPEFRVGRIKHERIKVPRSDEQLFDYAVRVMEFHAPRKAILEVEYVDEEGTGLGPTLEFYALVAAEFQRKSLAMWYCDDADDEQANELDLGGGYKPPGYYVRRAGGLFPAPLPLSSAENIRASELFRVLGIFLAKVLQDGRLVDLPLSQPFLKMITSSQVAEKEIVDLDGVLDLNDLEEISPLKGNVLKELAAFVGRKHVIEANDSLDNATKQRLIQEMKLNINGLECTVEDLSLTFCINPPSSIFKYGQLELIENGANIDVTTENVETFVSECSRYYLNFGIQNQLRAFRKGFDLVFPLRYLRLFSPGELQTLLSGDQCPEWTREDIINFTEPKLGYTKESPGFLRFVDVLVGMNATERKSFLQFTTGCSSLPPGGLANLHPRLTIVRKVDSGDGSYPSVNTCVHYLKLPDYSSAEIMRERLLAATNEKGFHLN